jgi:c-di-GMP-binding flagellar brake protein YcgR
MYENGLTMGKKLELELLDSDVNKIRHTFVSQFENYLGDQTMEILAPIYEGKIYPVHIGEILNVIYERDKNLYKFSAEVQDRKVANNINFLIIKQISEEVRLQRRAFFRFKCILDVEYRIFENRNCEVSQRGEFKKGITKDISGGGLCILVNGKAPYKHFVEGILKIGNGIHFIGRIVRTNDLKGKSVYNYEVGLKFVDISPSKREKLISYIFESQRKILQKGWEE